ncbi:hypothetical protein NMG60_11035281 [Bertholletia excelsa]
MGSSVCFFRNPLQWTALFAPFLVYSAFVGFGFFPFLFTAVALISSSIFFSFSKHKPVLVEKPVNDEKVVSYPRAEIENMTKEEENLEVEVSEKVSKQGQDGPLDSLSAFESIERSFTADQDSEVEWPHSGNLVDCSEDSISDEEGLIEIALPSGHYVSPEEEEEGEEEEEEEEEEKPKFIFQPKNSDLLQDSIFKQQSLVELLADINEVTEEDNLIEIDISMGSIKCSRFEIEA